MNKTRGEAAAYVAELCDWMRAAELDVQVAIFPPFTALQAVSGIALINALACGLCLTPIENWTPRRSSARISLWF